MLPITSENWAAVLGLYHSSINSLEANIPLQISQSENHMKNIEVCRWIHWEVIYLSREGANIFSVFVWKLMGSFHR